MRDLDLSIVDTAELPARAAQRIASILRAAAQARGSACLAVAGGTTPRAVHEALASLGNIPWDRVHVFFGDERCVAPDHPDSNYRMAKE
jgi:6-phosphogluconolactonase